jgi:hypothetical protein
MADTEFGPDRDDTGGVQLLVAAVVVRLMWSMWTVSAMPET